MPWRRSRRHLAAATQVLEPFVVTVTDALTDQTADDVATQVERLPASTPVVIDLTAIPAFDTEGTDRLLHLQAARGAERTSIVGFRQAVSRLVGGDDMVVEARDPAGDAPGDGWRIRRMRNLAVVQAEGAQATEPADRWSAALEQAVTAAVAEEVAIVVIDLRPVAALTAEAVQVIAYGSGSAALRGQEMLIVNVSPEAADQLRRAGLSATTFVAPEPILDDRS